ncbi:hypothetical protein [Streptomyces sp. NPDC051162]|uniref:hypothetical protein n=1 Tax=Streptomyces sp. NPDC051162 TaxID=3154747 RepID=UPI00342064D8
MATAVICGDQIGGRMAPEPLIHALYPQGAQSNAAYSVARTNAEQLHAKGLLTGLIELDRGTWATVPTPSAHAPAIRHQSQGGKRHADPRGPRSPHRRTGIPESPR